MLLGGLGGFASFFAYHAPNSQGIELFPMGPNGHYMLALAGCALVAWGVVLIGAARHPSQARSVGTASALGLVLCGLHRMVAWIVGDYALMSDFLRAEAALFLLLALAFVWLRPPHPTRAPV